MTNTLNLENARFDGADYIPYRDNARLKGQLLRVFGLMRDRRWRTLNEIALSTDDPPASISAQLRHLRKPRFGAYVVERRYAGNGLHEYRLLAPNQL